MADASYPDDLKYHPEHDWARIDGDVATFGITWYAQDQLGEVVFVDPPEVGKTVSKDEPYAEIESVKAVSDVVAPLSGEIVEVNEALGDAPEKINEDPYGDGWLVKVRLTRAVRGRGAAGPRGVRGQPQLSRYTSATDADREAMLEAHRRRLDRRAVRRHPRGRPAGPADRPAARQAGAGGVRVPARPRARATSRPTTRSRSSAPGCTTTTCPSLVDALLSRSEFLTPYTPYQPEVSQGTLQVMFEYQTAISELTGLPVSNATLYEAPSAVASAGWLARLQNGRGRFLVSRGLHPHSREALATTAAGYGTAVEEVRAERAA